MSNRLVTALLVKNEADKYLERVIRRCMEFSDECLILDDGSTDGSDRLAWRLGCGVKKWTGQTMWGNESPARAALWDWGARVAGDGWLLIADADMLLHGDPRPLTLSRQYNCWSFILYDLWDSEQTYRCDSYWQGHLHPRPWMFRPNHLDCVPPIWPDRGLHVGHCPKNARLNPGIADPALWYYNHLGYVRGEARMLKANQYLEKADLLSDWELAHARSVGDPQSGPPS